MSIIASQVRAQGKKFLAAVNQMGGAEVRAMNLTMRGVRTDADRAIRERLALPQKFVLPQIKIRKAVQETRPKAVIYTREKGMPYRVQGYGAGKAPHYKATQLRTGTKLRYFKGAAKKQHNRFAVRVAGQGKMAEGSYKRRYGGRVFKRTGEQGVSSKTGRKYDKFTTVWGPSIFSQMKKTYVRDRMDRRYAKDLPRYLRQQEDLVLRKVKIL